jgi:hypothetical protein
MKKIIFLIIIIVAVFVANKFFNKSIQVDDLKNTGGTNLSTRVDPNYVPTKEEIGEKVWTGLGFEPGFVLQINKRQNLDDKNISEYPTTVTFQKDGKDDGQVTGVLEMSKIVKSSDFVVFKGNLLVGGDAAVNTNIQMEKKSCTKPSGEKSTHTVKIIFGDSIFFGCAESIK